MSKLECGRYWRRGGGGRGVFVSVCSRKEVKIAQQAGGRSVWAGKEGA